MITQGSGIVLPEGTIKKVQLTGEQLVIEILGPTDSWETAVRYPDGMVRHHQVQSVIALLDKIAGQLKGRYNLQDFQFTQVPESLSTGETVTIGEIKYG